MTVRRSPAARAILTLAGAAVVAHLFVRLATIDRAQHRALALVTLGAEVLWLFGVLTVAAALARPTTAHARRTVPDDETAVIVRVPRSPDPAGLRATLIALGTLPRNRHVVVADASGAAEVAALAATYGAAHHVTEPDDRLGTGVELGTTVRWVSILDSGDVPAMELVDALTSIAATRFDIAVVQGAVRAVSERGDLEQHRLREPILTAGRLNPALGAARAAMWCGSGAVFARAAWDDLCALPRRSRRNEMSASLALLGNGWQILAPPVPVVVATPGSASTQARVRLLRRRCADAVAATASLASIARRSRGTSGRRAWAVAWLVAHTGPARLAAGSALALASVLLGASPVVLTPSVVVSALLCSATLTLATVHDRLDAVRPGDGTRRAIGALTGGAVAAVLLGRAPRRAGPRVPADLAGSFAGRPASVVDLTVRGAGLVVPEPLTVGTRAALSVSLPRHDGRRTRVVVDGVVRYGRPDPAAGFRVGIELVDVAPVAFEALTEFCRVSFPRRLLRALPPDARETSPSLLPELVQ